MIKKTLWNPATLIGLQNTCLKTTSWKPQNRHPGSGHDYAYATDWDSW